MPAQHKPISLRPVKHKERVLLMHTGIVMDIVSTANEITDDLRRLGKGARQAHRPSAQSEFGVYASDYYKVVKNYKQRLKLESDSDMYNLAIALLEMIITECRYIAYALLAFHPSAA